MAKGLPQDVIKGPLSSMLSATDRAKLAQTRKKANKILQPQLKKEKNRFMSKKKIGPNFDPDRKIKKADAINAVTAALGGHKDVAHKIVKMAGTFNKPKRKKTDFSRGFTGPRRKPRPNRIRISDDE